MGDFQQIAWVTVPNALMATDSATPSPTATASAGNQSGAGDPNPSGTSFDASVLLPVLLGALIAIAGQTALEFVKDTMAKRKEARDAARALAKEDRDKQSTLDKEAKSRAQDAAQEVDRLISDLSRQLRAAIKGPELEGDQARAARELRDETFDELGAQAAFLPADLRARVGEIVSVLRHAQRIGRTGDQWRVPYHYFHASVVVEKCAKEAHELIASFLGHRPVPARSSEMIELLVARDELWEANLDEFGPEIAEEQADANKWAEAHRGAIVEYMRGKAPQGS